MATSLDAQIAKMKRTIAAKNAKKSAPNINKDLADNRDLTNNAVTRSNALSRAYYRFSLAEKRVMESLISRLHPQRNDNELQDIKLLATDYANAYKVDLKNAYRDLMKAADGLLSRVIVTTEPPYTVKTTLMTQAKYHENQGHITCTLNPSIVPHLIGMRKKFNSYPLSKTVDFSSSYTWRLYEILVSWAQPKSDTGGVFCGWFDVEVDEFRRMLGVPDSYNQGRFKQVILDVAENELLHKTDINVRFSPKKTGRKITSYNVTFADNEQQQLSL